MVGDNITLKELRELGARLSALDLTGPEWKRIVKEFAVKHGLSDIEAIQIAKTARGMDKEDGDE